MVTLAQMQNTVRRVTARYTEAQMTTTQINTYINLAYTIHFPEQFRNLKLTKPYVFQTIPNVDTYPFVYESGLPAAPGGAPTQGNITIMPPVYCQGYILRYFQDKSTFYNRWPKLTVNQQVGTGFSGATTTSNFYSGTIPSTPFLRAQLDIFGNVKESAVIFSSFDNSGFSVFYTDIPRSNSNIGDIVDGNNVKVGTVNYFTGAWTLGDVSSITIPAGDPIYASVIPYQSSRPTDVIFYNQQITFRPVPQQVYQVEFQISQQPTQLLAQTDQPELDEWYLFICLLAADLIYTDFPDPEGQMAMRPMLQEQREIAQRRTLRQIGSQRSATIFSQPTRPLASFFWGQEYSGTAP